MELAELTPLTALTDPTKEANKQAKFMIIAVIIFSALVVGAVIFLSIRKKRA